MKSSCISHPERERLVIIRKWQIIFCNSNHCAAAVLSFFEYWHNWKLDSDERNQQVNDIAEMHGDARHLSEDIYQFHSMQEISDGILNLYGTKAIAEAIKFLISKNVISEHANPNPNYFYDKKKYFRFYPETCNEWIKNHYKSGLGKNAECARQKSLSHSEKMPNALSKNTTLLGKNAVSITKINNKDNNHAFNARARVGAVDNFIAVADDAKAYPSSSHPIAPAHNEITTKPLLAVQPVIDALMACGLAPEKFSYPDVEASIDRLQQQGANAGLFIEAYDIAVHQTPNFGVNYLCKIVEGLLNKAQTAIKTASKTTRNSSASRITLPSSAEPDWKDDVRAHMHWLGDIIAEHAEVMEINTS